MRVLLVEPPLFKKNTVGPPLGLGYLASSLENLGHSIKIIDSCILGYELEDIKREIIDFDPDVVGITSSTQHISKALSIANFSKENNPNCLTVLGGPHPTIEARQIIKENLFVDVVVRGEGEKTFTELLEVKNKYNWKNVKGISFRINGKIFENTDREMIEDLDDLPFPSYHLFPMNKYKVRYRDNNLFGKIGQNYCGIITSRGCPYNCNFCASRALWGKKWRCRNPENVIQEIKLLRDDYGVKVIDFQDDTFSIDVKRVESICKKIHEEKIDVSFICTTRVNDFNKNLAKILKKSGFILIAFGLESGVQQTLDYLCKGFSIYDSLNAVKYAKQAKLKVWGSFIIGVPNETKDMIYETIKFAKKLRLSLASFHIYVPFPGTKIYEIAQKNNLLLTDDWSKYSPINSILKLDHISSEELKSIFNEANFYYSIKRLFNFLYW